MAQSHDTMMNPPIEELLDRVDSKFSLVTLAARRARNINSYFNQLGEGLGHMIPPQVSRRPASRSASRSRRSPPTRSSGPMLGAGRGRARPARGRRRPRRRPRRRHRLSRQLSTAMLAGKRIVLGVTGGIAAYKAVEVSRRLVDAGAHVVPVMTKGAEHFLGAHDAVGAGQRAGPTSVGRPRDPDPAHPARPACRPGARGPRHGPPRRRVRAGLSTDLLTNILLATRAPVMSARRCTPRCGSTPRCRTTSPRCARGACTSSSPSEGRLAGGDVGAGRLASPSRIVAAVERVFGPATISPARRCRGERRRHPRADRRRPGDRQPQQRQAGLRAAAEAHARRRVTLVSTVDLPVPPASRVVRVETAAQMQAAMDRARPERPTSSSWPPRSPTSARCRRPTGKLKKHDGSPTIVLEPTPDILAGLGARKPAGQVLVGFAAETDDLIANAERKLRAQAARPDRRQRRRRARCGLPARHQRRYAVAVGGRTPWSVAAR
jgi:phosphopantothenoylcysteine decarboxylase / phosphopantothenate---cysteine ligase